MVACRRSRARAGRANRGGGGGGGGGDDVQDRDLDRRFDLRRHVVHGVGADQQGVRGHLFQAARGVDENLRGAVPVTDRLHVRDRSKIARPDSSLAECQPPRRSQVSRLRR